MEITSLETKKPGVKIILSADEAAILRYYCGSLSHDSVEDQAGPSKVDGIVELTDSIYNTLDSLGY